MTLRSEISEPFAFEFSPWTFIRSISLSRKPTWTSTRTSSVT